MARFMLTRLFCSLALACGLACVLAATDVAAATPAVTSSAPPPLELTVERVPGADGSMLYQIASSGTVAASPAAVWRVLTDYNRMADYVPDLKSARVVARDGDKVILEQHGAARMLFFSRDIHLIVEVHEQAPHRIDVSLIDGDMKVYRCSWEISAVAATGGSRISYNASIEPKFYVPGLVGTSMVRKDIAKMMSAVLLHLDRNQ